MVYCLNLMLWYGGVVDCFFLRFKYSLRSVCQLYIANGAAVNPSEALRLPPYAFKSRYKLPHPRKISISGELPEWRFYLVGSFPNPPLFASLIIRFNLAFLPAIYKQLLSDFKLYGMIKML